MRPVKESQRLILLEQRLDKPVKDALSEWHWQRNLRHREIGIKLGIPRPTITRWFKYFNIPSQSGTRFTNLNLLNVGPRKTPPAKLNPRKEKPWRFNKSFFESWTPKIAYVLGYLIADGCILINPRGSYYFSFTSTDKELIEKVKKLLGSNHRIGVAKSKRPHWKNRYGLQIGSKNVFRKLKRLGVVQNKSLVINFSKQVPKKFLGHFVRGYFDGDGCVYFKPHLRKDRNKLQWVFRVSFTSGSKDFLEGLHDALRKSIQGGFIGKKRGAYELVFSRHDSLALFKLMYNGVSKEMFLERKYQAFQKAFRILKMEL